MARILITQQLVDGGLDALEGSGHEVTYRQEASPMARAELLAAIGSFEAIICTLADTIDDEVLAAGVRLSVVANVAVGYDNIDLGAALRRGITVCNTPGVLDGSTAELTMLLMLAARRRSSDREADLRQGRWLGWGIAGNLGLDLSGATLGLVGYGRIAQAVARRAAAFDMSVLHHTRRPTGEPGWCASLLEMAAATDVLSVHVPLSPVTTGLIDRSVLAALRPTAVVINTARGPVVDEAALAEALEEGRLWGAGLDVYVGEPTISARLLAAPHTVLLPHIGSATAGTRLAMCRLAVNGVLEVLSGRRPANIVEA